MSIEIGFFLALLIIAVPVGLAAGRWLHRSSRLARLMDPKPRPEDDCPCGVCTYFRAEREGGTGEQ